MGIAARILANQVTQIAIHFLRVESVELDEHIRAVNLFCDAQRLILAGKEVAGFNAGTQRFDQNTFIVGGKPVGGITQIIDKRGAITCAISAIRHDAAMM